MADVRARGEDRAQLLLVSAIGLAILLVLLALALNTAAYGGVHVAQTDTGPDEERAAVQYQGAAERALAGLMASGYENATDYDELEDDFREDVGKWDRLAKTEYARDGAATAVTVTNVSFESRIVDDDAGGFEDQNGSTGWTVAENVSDVSAYTMNVTDDENLVETDDCASSGDCFTVEVEGGGGDVWYLFAFSPNGSNQVNVTVEQANGSQTTCGPSDPSVDVDLVDGVFDPGGENCTFTSFLEDGGLDPPYTVRYVDADDVNGTYDLTVSGTVVEDTIADDDRYNATGSPRVEPALEAANVSIGYRSPDLRYRTETRVIRGEDDG